MGKLYIKFFAILLCVLSATGLQAQQVADSTATPVPSTKQAHWYDDISMRGYTQVRYNRLAETNSKLKCEQCDRSWGDGGGLSLRRARLVFFGNVHPRVYMYIQGDLASSVASNQPNYFQMRDAYFDLSLDNKKTFRLRLGQSKVPYGFDNMQSSQNRPALDRSDAINSAFVNERDIAGFFYWAPTKARKRFADLSNARFKGSGDYGVFAFGTFNGQGGNKLELNNSLGTVARLAYPFKIGKKQIIEPGVQAYTNYVQIESRSASTKGQKEFLDERAAASFVLYPQPIGIQAEWNMGQGPEYNPANKTIEFKPLEGGYVTLSFAVPVKKQLLYPFVRAQYYKGGKKHELDARSHKVNEYSGGIEWQPIKNLETTFEYVHSDRTTSDGASLNNHQKGNLLRIQVQFNY